MRLAQCVYFAFIYIFLIYSIMFIFCSVMVDFFTVNRMIYDPKRGLPMDCKNPQQSDTQLRKYITTQVATEDSEQTYSASGRPARKVTTSQPPSTGDRPPIPPVCSKRRGKSKTADPQPKRKQRPEEEEVKPPGGGGKRPRQASTTPMVLMPLEPPASENHVSPPVILTAITPALPAAPQVVPSAPLTVNDPSAPLTVNDPPGAIFSMPITPLVAGSETIVSAPTPPACGSMTYSQFAALSEIMYDKVKQSCLIKEQVRIIADLQEQVRANEELKEKDTFMQTFRSFFNTG